MNKFIFCLSLLTILSSCQSNETPKSSAETTTEQKKVTVASLTKVITSQDSSITKTVKTLNVAPNRLVTPLPFDSDLYVKCTNTPKTKLCKERIQFIDEAKIPEYAKSFSTSAERLRLPNLSDGTEVFVSANAEGDDADVGSTVTLELINPQKKRKILIIQVGQSIKIDKEYQAKIYEYQKGKMRLIKQGYIADLSQNSDD